MKPLVGRPDRAGGGWVVENGHHNSKLAEENDRPPKPDKKHNTKVCVCVCVSRIWEEGGKRTTERMKAREGGRTRADQAHFSGKMSINQTMLRRKGASMNQRLT